jgi:hypothetical protein
MNPLKIEVLSYEIEPHCIEFRFDSETKFSRATLQLPDTGDSIHFIDDVESDCDSEVHDEIIKQLSAFYFQSFGDDGELGAASAEVGEAVIRVREVRYANAIFYVAYTVDDAAVLVESGARDYYQKRYLFDWPNESHYQIGEFERLTNAEIIAKADKEEAS